MSMPIVLQGIAIGLSIAAPVGPIGVLCMKRTLVQGRAFGIVSGLGAASADAAYGLLAAFGLGIVMEALLKHQDAIRLAGGVFLLYLGWKSLAARPAEREAEARGGDKLAGAYASTFALTLTNPMTILSFLGIFAGVGASGNVAASSLWTVLGIFLGSTLWWLILCFAVGAFRRTLNAAWMRVVNRASGVVLAAFGIMAIAGILR